MALSESDLERTCQQPEKIVPLEDLPRWLDQRMLSSNPFDVITTRNKEKEAFFESEMNDRHEAIVYDHDRLQEKLSDATTEAQWRRRVHSIWRRMSSTMAEWQFWHQLWLCAKNGWLGGPLWNLCTATQGDTLAEMLADERPITDRSLSGAGKPNKRPFKSMDVKTDRDWNGLADQLDKGITVSSTVVDIGRVPTPHNEQTHSDNASVRKYLYRVGRLNSLHSPEDAAGQDSDAPLLDSNQETDPNDADTPSDHDDGVSESSVSNDAGDDPPERPDENEEPASSEAEDDRAEDAAGDLADDTMELDEGAEADSEDWGDAPEVRVDADAAQRHRAQVKLPVAAQFRDARCVELDRFQDVAWESGFPNPWDQMGECIEKANGVHRYEHNRGEAQDGRKEAYIIDLHTGLIWLVPGIEGSAVFRTVVEYYDDKGKVDIASPLAWMDVSKEKLLDGQSRHNELERLLKRAQRAGMHNVHELYTDEQKGAGPPPSKARLENLRERVEEYEKAERRKEAESPLDVKCPQCHASPGQECLSASGDRMDAESGHWHVEREQYLQRDSSSQDREKERYWPGKVKITLGEIPEDRWTQFRTRIPGTLNLDQFPADALFESGPRRYLLAFEDRNDENAVQAWEIVSHERWKRIPHEQKAQFDELDEAAGTQVTIAGDHYRAIQPVVFVRSKNADAEVST